MKRASDELTAAELAVMEVLWESAEGVAIREIVLAVYGRHEHSLHAAVKSFLDRLLAKSYVSVDSRGFSHLYSAAVNRETYVGQQLKQMAETLFGGSMAPLLMSLTDQVKLSRKDREAIRSIIEGIRE